MRVTATAALATVIAESCSLQRLLRDEAAKLRNGVIYGRVAAPEGRTAGVVAVLFREGRKGPVVAGYAALSEMVDSYVFVAPTGDRFFVVAFADRNANLMWDRGEPAGAVGGPSPITVASRQLLQVDEITLRDGVPPAGFSLDVRALPAEAGPSVPLALGALARLDDPKVDTTRGGTGITPRDFQAAIAALDRSRFQPGIFHYPSGARLASSPRRSAAVSCASTSSSASAVSRRWRAGCEGA